MNHTLTALMTKLTWQNNDLTLQLQTAQKQSWLSQNQIQTLVNQINQSSLTQGNANRIINPEIEMSRLHFITKQQNEKELLNNALKNHQAVEQQLKDKLQNLKIELKMLEKHLKKAEQIQGNQQTINQEQALDEWVLQRRGSA